MDFRLKDDKLDPTYLLENYAEQQIGPKHVDEWNKINTAYSARALIGIFQELSEIKTLMKDQKTGSVHT